MTDHSHILTLAQWLSPAYPVGAFAYSHGLEAAAKAGWVADGTSLTVWLEDVLRHGAGRNDVLLIVAAYHAEGAEVLEEIDNAARAFAASKERLLEADQQGAAFARVTSAVWGAELQELTYPVALGRAAALEGMPPVLTAKMYLAAFLSNLIAAGQRLLPIGQTEAQSIHRALTPLAERIAEEAVNGTLDSLASSAFLADIASMKHETQYARIFRS